MAPGNAPGTVSRNRPTIREADAASSCTPPISWVAMAAIFATTVSAMTVRPSELGPPPLP